MRYAIQWIRSLLFIIQMYLVMAVMAVLWLIPMLISRDGARHACTTYARYVQWSARWMVGLRCEVRGTPPHMECVVAAKHQSFLDIILIYAALPRPKFIMKRELLYAPILGQYAYRAGCVPVARGKRAEAMTKMVADVKAGHKRPGQLCIYPQGTRVAPGVEAPYKIGTAVLYEQLGQPCVPVATNVGVFWPKHGIYRAPGLAVVEFMDVIEPGLSKAEIMARMEDDIEKRSDALMAEAGFQG